MADLRSTTVNQYNILGSTGAHEIVTRAALRNGGGNQTIIPGTVMQISEDDPRACAPWDGEDETEVCGVALEGMTLTNTSKPLNILASGTVNNNDILIHGGGVPDPLQWNQMQVQAKIVPQGFEYTPEPQ